MNPHDDYAALSTRDTGITGFERVRPGAPSGSARTIRDVMSVPDWAMKIPSLFDVSQVPPREPSTNFSELLEASRHSSGDGGMSLQFSMFMAVTQSYASKQYGTYGYNKEWLPGDPMFVSRLVKANFSRNDVPRAWLNVGQMNEVLRRGYDGAVGALVQAERDELRTGESAVGNTYRELVRDGMLDDNERTWFGNDRRKAYQNRPTEMDVRYLTKHGVQLMWNCLGVCIANNSTTDMPLHTVAVQGPIDVLDVVGRDGRIATHVHLVLKRLLNPGTGMYEQYAFVPYVSLGTAVPSLAERMYEDMGGYVQYGDVYYVGQIIDTEHVPNPPRQVRALLALGNAISPKERQDARPEAATVRMRIGPRPGEFCQVY